MRYLAGRGGGIGGSLALGTGDIPATVNDTRLTFEVYRATIDVISISYSQNLLIFKASIPQEISLRIQELGLFSLEDNSANTGLSRLLTSFETDIELWSNGSYVETNNRIGSVSLRMQPAANGTLEATLGAVLDLSAYTPDDNFTIAFTKGNGNVSSLTLRFRDDFGNSFSQTSSVTSLTNSYHIVTFPKKNFVTTGEMFWNSITSVSVSVAASAGGAADVFLDGIRIEDDDSPTIDYGLVSRSVLPAPFIKSTIAPMDVEYALELSIV